MVEKILNASQTLSGHHAVWLASQTTRIRTSILNYLNQSASQFRVDSSWSKIHFDDGPKSFRTGVTCRDSTEILKFKEISQEWGRKVPFG
jgi:hypothetical protein